MRNTLFLLVLFGSKLFGQSNFYLGADLSYVNEVEDAGAIYRYQKKKIDPYQLFAEKKCNLVRLRLWHQPSHSPYSNLTDVTKSIQRAKKQGMQVLLDFHYSDTWADPEKQYIPKAWSEISELKILGDSVYQYTYKSLEHLFRLKLLPEMVQIGNETNHFCDREYNDDIDDCMLEPVITARFPPFDHPGQPLNPPSRHT